jgi:hypothetical protein
VNFTEDPPSKRGEPGFEGYFVNGIQGAVSTPTAGFFAGGLPATLGDGFFVTYVSAHIVPPVFPLPPEVYGLGMPKEKAKDKDDQKVADKGTTGSGKVELQCN